MAAKKVKTEETQSVAASSFIPRRPPREITDISELPAEKLAEIEAAMPEGWVDDDAGAAFPPYWKPEIGAYFRAVPLFRDERDMDFTRWHLEARTPLECMRGDKDAKEYVTVGTGEIFTLSGCKGLALERYVGFEIMVVVTGVSQLPPNEASQGIPRDFYHFRVKVTQETKKQLTEMRAHVRGALIEQSKKRALDNMVRIAAGQLTG